MEREGGRIGRMDVGAMRSGGDERGAIKEEEKKGDEGLVKQASTHPHLGLLILHMLSAARAHSHAPDICHIPPSFPLTFTSRLPSSSLPHPSLRPTHRWSKARKVRANPSSPAASITLRW